MWRPRCESISQDLDLAQVLSLPDLTSHFSPTTKIPLTGSNTIHHLVHTVCNHRPDSLYLSVHLVHFAPFQERGDLHRHIPNHRHCGDVPSRAPRAQPQLTLKRWRRSPASLKAHCCDRSRCDLPMHPPSSAFSRSNPLSQPRHTTSHNCKNFRTFRPSSLEVHFTASLVALARVRHPNLSFT